jgi:Cu+-exporting ATPase
MENQSRQAGIAVEGMTCASCVAHVEKAIRGVEGVKASQVNLARGRAVVEYDPARTNPDKVAAAIEHSGYTARPEDAAASVASVEEDRLSHQHAHAHAWLIRAIIGLSLWLPVELTHWVLYLATPAGHQVAQHHMWMNWLALSTSTLGILLVGVAFYRGAWAALKHGTSNMDTLIAMGASVAYFYSLAGFVGYLLGRWALPDLYFMESTGLLGLISFGHWLEARARSTAGSAIRELLNLAPATAQRLEDDGHTHEVPVAAVQRGNRLLVRPGDRVPVDGTVIEGNSEVDESMISGEALPVTKSPGDEVIGGTANQNGRLIIRATQVGAETALAQIVRLVESAQSSKPPVQQLADRISAVFVPAVLLIALATGIGWYLWAAAHSWPSSTTWATIAKAVCSVLIIACPCALGLAVPATLMVGIGRGARRGILIRDIDALQSAERIDIVVLDKTGTVTQGKPAVTAVIPANGHSDVEVLRLAAAAEQYSEHPLARAIVRYARDRQLELPNPESFTNESGFGVVAVVAGKQILVGNEALLQKHGLMGAAVNSTAAPGQIIVQVAAHNDQGAVEFLGTLTLADPIKTDSAAAIAELHGLNLRTVLLTGDNRATAESIASQVGIGDVRAQVRPSEKAQAIRQLQAAGVDNQKSKINIRQSYVAMVGDGINDAPALAAADLGIAIGSGSDIAKETGGIVLVSGSLHGIATAIRLSRATMTKIRQNLFLAFIYNVLAIPLAAFGLLNPLIAAAAMALSDVTVLGNALLLRRKRID